MALHPGDAAGAHPMGGGYQGGDDTSDIGCGGAEGGTHSVLRLGGGQYYGDSRSLVEPSWEGSIKESAS